MDVRPLPRSGIVKATTEQERTILKGQAKGLGRLPIGGGFVLVALCHMLPGAPAPELWPERLFEVLEIGTAHDAVHATPESLERLDNARNRLAAALATFG